MRGGIVSAGRRASKRAPGDGRRHPAHRVPWPGMRIRDAKTDDLDFIVASNSALASETEDVTLDPALLRPGVASALADRSLGRYYIAEAEGQPVGQLMVTGEWSDWRNGLFLWIQSVYVTPAHRGTGVFRALY